MKLNPNTTVVGRYQVKAARPDGNGLLHITSVNDREQAKKLAQLLAKHLNTHVVAVDIASRDHFFGRYGSWMSESGAREILGNIGRPSAAVAFTRLYMDLRGGQA